MYGLDTSGVIQANDLAFDPDMAAHSSPYGGSQPSIVRGCLAILPDPRGLQAFVDLGCGKGRPLLVASEFPFQRVVGVEIAPRLAEIARQNARPRPPTGPAGFDRGSGRRRDHHRGAGSSHGLFPADNPFDTVLIGGVAGNIAAQLGERLEHAFIVYYNPVHAQVFDRSPHFARWSARRLWYASDEVATALISTTRC